MLRLYALRLTPLARPVCTPLWRCPDLSDARERASDALQFFGDVQCILIETEKPRRPVAGMKAGSDTAVTVPGP